MDGASAKGVVDAWPNLEVQEGELWTRARDERDRIAEAVRTAVANAGFRALVHLSAPGQFPLWVQLIAWVPTGTRQDGARADHRVSLTITSEVHPYREDEIRYNVTWQSPREGGVLPARSINNCARFTPGAAAAMALFILQGGRNPLQNEIDSRKTFAFVKTFLPFLEGPGENKLKPAYEGQFFTWPMSLGIISILFIAMIVTIPLGLASIIAAFVIMLRRRRSVAIVYKPNFEPRWTRLIDTWHAVTAIPIEEAEAVRQRLFSVVKTSNVEGMVTEVESYGYFGPDGYIIRDQLVVRLRQALVFVHIYCYQNELFIGWDASLNMARWGESKAVSKRVEGRNLVEYRELTSITHKPNEYDIIDVNVASEMVHRRLRDEIRRVLDEFDIKEEIDFSVTRGDRDSALRSDDKEKVERRKRVTRVS